MKSVLLLIAIGVVGCDGPAPAPATPSTKPASTTEPAGLPIVHVDAAHSMRMHQAPSLTTPYLLNASSGIIVDGGKYSFMDPRNQGRFANVAQVLYERSEYKTAWPDHGRQIATLDASTLVTLKGDTFNGFAAGKQAIIAVGYREESEKEGAIFEPFWVGNVIFK